MIARAGGYYGNSFKIFRGVTQGDPLSPTIFNMVVDSVVWLWLYYMVDRSGWKGGHGREGRHQNSLFYAYDGMVASSDPG